MPESKQRTVEDYPQPIQEGLGERRPDHDKVDGKLPLGERPIAGAVRCVSKEEENLHGENVGIDTVGYLQGFRYWLAITVLCMAIFLLTLDSTIIATATPYITDEFNSLGDIGWYANIYPMAIATSQLTYGKLCARYSIRCIYSTSMMLFLIGSAVCASAPSSATLIAGRAISGLGSSGLLIGAFSLVPQIASPPQIPTSFGIMSASRGLATTCGPLIGGALTQHVSWRWNFYINLPLGTAILAVFLYAIRSPQSARHSFNSWRDFFETLDLAGLFALLGSVVCLFLALQWGGIDYPWGSDRIVALLILSGVLGAVFIGVESFQGERAMLPLYIIRQRTVLAASFFSLCITGAIFIITYYLPIWFQAVKQKTPLSSGVSTLPWVITSTVTALMGGALISKLGHTKAFVIIGCAFCCIGSGLFTTFEPNTTRGKWVGYQIVYAVGSSLSSFTPLILVQDSLERADIPIGSAMVMFCQSMGSALFVSITQALFSNDLSAGLQHLGLKAFDGSTVGTAGVTLLTQSAPPGAKERVLEVINHALTSSWVLPVVLSCISILGALGIEHRTEEQVQKVKDEKSTKSGDAV